MERLRRAAIITLLADKLRERGSWCGETHLQKAVYLLQELTDTSTGFDFVLYKHGPFSFELRDELTALRADQLIEYDPQPYPFGPRIAPTEASKRLRAVFAATLDAEECALDFAADAVGNSGVVELEKIATAVYVTRQQEDDCSREERAERLTELKPHISLESAIGAIEKADELLDEADRSFCDSAS